MLGLLINEQEHKEMIYLVQRELDELLFYMEDHYSNQAEKRAMQKRYRTLFQLLRRVASDEECLEYVPKKSEHK